MEESASDARLSRRSGIRHFRASDHPGDQAVAVVFGRLLVKPLAATMIPVMIVGLALVLQEHDPLSYIMWSFPLAFVLAAVWTSYRMRSVVAEVRVARNGAMALSAFEISTQSTDPHLQRVFDIRGTTDAVNVTIGLATVRLERSRWPDLAEMEVYLREARDYYT